MPLGITTAFRSRSKSLAFLGSRRGVVLFSGGAPQQARAVKSIGGGNSKSIITRLFVWILLGFGGEVLPARLKEALLPEKGGGEGERGNERPLRLGRCGHSCFLVRSNGRPKNLGQKRGLDWTANKPLAPRAPRRGRPAGRSSRGRRGDFEIGAFRPTVFVGRCCSLLSRPFFFLVSVSTRTGRVNGLERRRRIVLEG